MNKVIISGRIASDIELKSTASNVSVCSFRIAVNRRFKNDEGRYDADFINCVAWRSSAEFIKNYFKKGEPIEIAGTLQTRTYEKEGQKSFVTEVLVEEVNFVVQNKNEAQTSSQPLPQDDFVSLSDDDDLPF